MNPNCLGRLPQTMKNPLKRTIADVIVKHCHKRLTPRLVVTIRITLLTEATSI